MTSLAPLFPSSAKNFDAILREIAVSDARYESAERSYHSVSGWLTRANSSLGHFDIDVYSQGSFQLGTVNKPIGSTEKYDLDVICQVGMSRLMTSQAELLDGVGRELRLYASHRGMKAPIQEDCCWTLEYAEGASFCMDIVPAIPDGERQRQLLKAARMDNAFIEDAIAITDRMHPAFRLIGSEWKISNPKGYAKWFKERMRPVYELMKRAHEDARRSIEQLPKFNRKTPLQLAVQILKRHRDLRFAESATKKPSSIIITTLAAQGYGQETSTLDALNNILRTMEHRIETRNGVDWIENPADPRVNFADSWAKDSSLKESFLDWLETARIDFESAAKAPDDDAFADALAPRLGRELVEKALHRPKLVLASKDYSSTTLQEAVAKIKDAPHRKPCPWPVEAGAGKVWISSARCERSGWRPMQFTSGGQVLPKRASLTFQATTTIQKPYRVYWQIVNVGQQAAAAKGLRGGFEDGDVLERGELVRKEDTLYTGTHSIECFIVRNDRCLARSGSFMVTIE